jgi:hypothetical protein
MLSNRQLRRRATGVNRKVERVEIAMAMPEESGFTRTDA